MEARGETNQPGHADIVRIVVLHVLFAAQGVDDGGFNFGRELHQLLVSAGAAAAAHERDIAGVADKLRQLAQLFFRRSDRRQRRMIPVAAGALRGGLQRHVAGQHHHRDAAVNHRFTHGDGQHLRNLFRGGDQLAVVAAFAEQFLRMGLLKIAAADFAGGDVGGNGQYRYMVTMTVKQTVDQMQVTRSAGTGADRQLAGQLRLGAGGESSDLFVPGGHPVDGAHAVQTIAQSIEGISGDAPDTFHAGLFQRFGNVCGHGLFHDLHLLFVITPSSLDETAGYVADCPLFFAGFIAEKLCILWDLTGCKTGSTSDG